MTPEQQATLDLIQQILRYLEMEDSFDTIKALLLALWAGELTPEYAEFVRRMLLEWCGKKSDLLREAVRYALGLTGEAGGGAAGAIALPLIAPLLLLLAGLVLPASRMGDLGLQSPFDAYFGDDCEEFYAALVEANRRLRADYRAFNGIGAAATRAMAGALLHEIEQFQDACARFHRRCPDSPRNGSVTRMQGSAETVTADVLDWLAHH
jgi:hypothetical protein